MPDNQTPPPQAPSNQPAQAAQVSQNSAQPTVPVQTSAANQQPTALQANLTQAQQEQVKELKAKKRTRSLLTGCFSLGCGSIVLVFFAFLIFVSQTKEGAKPILQLFRIDEATLVNTLIDATHIGFGIFTFVMFLLALIGLFKTGIAKKDDKSAKRKGIVMSVLGTLLFFAMIFLWITAYLALSSKKIIPTQQIDYIITNPDNTIGLTAPMNIEFEAEDFPYDENKYTILSYLWDFGDGQTLSLIHI